MVPCGKERDAVGWRSGLEVWVVKQTEAMAMAMARQARRVRPSRKGITARQDGMVIPQECGQSAQYRASNGM